MTARTPAGAIPPALEAPAFLQGRFPGATSPKGPCVQARADFGGVAPARPGVRRRYAGRPARIRKSLTDKALARAGVFRARRLAWRRSRSVERFPRTGERGQGASGQARPAPRRSAGPQHPGVKGVVKTPQIYAVLERSMTPWSEIKSSILGRVFEFGYDPPMLSANARQHPLHNHRSIPAP